MGFQLLHQGFDGLDLAYRGQINFMFADALEDARDRASEARAPQLVRLNDIPMHVGESGCRGGYRYTCDTGPLGAVWFFKKPTSRDDWGIRVSVRSLPLAINGVEAVYSDLQRIIIALTGAFDPCNVSISRVDYALDYLTHEFQLVPDQFVMHSRLTRTVDREVSEVGRSGCVHSVRVGKMPGQQIAFYDKRADVVAKKKKVWWEIWNGHLALRGLTPIGPEQTKGRIWRIELRAGKEFLKERNAIRTWDDFRKTGGGVFFRMAEAIRYTSPCSDQNRARWPSHPIWLDVESSIRSGLDEMMTNVPLDRIREIARTELIDTLDRQILGCEAALISALDLEDVEFCDLVSFLKDRHSHQIDAAPERFKEKIHAASERYHFI